MSLFDRFKETPAAVRNLNHPRDLLVGDMVDFALMAQPELTNKSFQVTKIETLDLGGDSKKRTYFTLDDGNLKFRLRVCDEDTLEIAKEVTPNQLLEVFLEDDIAAILDAESGVNHHLKTAVAQNTLPVELSTWVAENYRQEGFELAYKYQQDYRQKALPDSLDGSEQGCDFAWLMSDDRQHALEFRVFDGGRTEAHLCSYLPLRKIDALWPAKQPS